MKGKHCKKRVRRKSSKELGKEAGIKGARNQVRNYVGKIEQLGTN